MTEETYYPRLMENPFYILGATPALGVRGIPDREEASRLIHGPELAAWAVAQLQDPYTRLAAETVWVYDVPGELLDGLLMGLEERSLAEIEGRCSGLGGLDQVTIAMDLIASRRPDIGLDPLSWLVRAWAELDRGEALRKINDLRGLAQEPAIDPDDFSRALDELRSHQVDFVTRVADGLITPGSELYPAFAAFVLNESIPTAPAGPAMEIHDPDEPALDSDTSWLDEDAPEDSRRQPEHEESFGLFDEEPPRIDMAEPAQPLPVQSDYQDPAVIDAILGIRDVGPEEAEVSEEIGEERGAPKPRRRRRLALLAGSGAVAASLIVLMLLSGGEDAPRPLEHGAGEPMLVLGQPQSSGDAATGPERAADGGAAVSGQELPPPPPTPVRGPEAEALPASEVAASEPQPGVVPPEAMSVSLLLVPDALDESPMIAVADADADRFGVPQVPDLPLPVMTHDLVPVAAQGTVRPTPQLRLARPPHGNDDRMSIEELRYCHVEFMTLERLPDFVLSEAAQRAMLFRALEHVSRCEGGSFLTEEMEQVRRELQHYDFASDAEKFVGKW